VWPPLTASAAARLAARFPRVAIAHEWLTTPGGSENVVLALLELFPQAELFTSVYDPAPWPAALRDRPVHTSFLDRLPGARRHYPRLLPLMNAAFEAFDFSAFDLVVSSSHASAKNVVTGPATRHLCYCHTPMRYAWDPAFMDAEHLGPAGRLAARALIPRLRWQDALGAGRPDVYLANSRHVAARIAKFYRREATVVHPPVAVDPLLATPRAPQDYYLCLGRLVPYKRVDLAIAACAQLGRRLKVAGAGREARRLEARAGGKVEFLGRVPDDAVPTLLAGARALLLPGEEDFGIVPVEAQAAGTPVIAYGVGGVLDSVVDGSTGLLFAEQSVEAVKAAILRFEARSWDPGVARENARRFAPEHFLAGVARAAEQLVATPNEAYVRGTPG
jgi:glycosyltransferase involved in cell wall biosynthesis